MNSPKKRDFFDFFLGDIYRLDFFCKKWTVKRIRCRVPASKVKSSTPFSSSLTYTIAERKERTTETDKERKKQTLCHHHLWEIWILMTRKTYRVVASTRNQSLLRKDLQSFLTC